MSASITESTVQSTETAVTKSCFNCKFNSCWSYAATLEEPADEGFECSHPQERTFPEVDADDLDDDAAGIAYAATCPGYEFKEWKQNPDVPFDAPDFPTLTDEAFIAYMCDISDIEEPLFALEGFI